MAVYALMGRAKLLLWEALERFDIGPYLAESILCLCLTSFSLVLNWSLAFSDSMAATSSQSNLAASVLLN